MCCPTLLKATIIHEIAHAIATWRCNHGLWWQYIIGTSMDIAFESGMLKLERLLQLETLWWANCRNVDHIYAKSVYAKIRELVWEYPHFTFEYMMGIIDFMAGPDIDSKDTVVDKKFKLCRRVYDIEKRKIEPSKTCLSSKEFSLPSIREKRFNKFVSEMSALDYLMGITFADNPMTCGIQLSLLHLEQSHAPKLVGTNESPI